MTKVRLCLLAIFFCFQTASLAVTSKIEASVDQTTIKENEFVTFSVFVYNLDPEFVNFPQDTADYTVTATSSSKNFRFVNGQSDRSITFKYVLSPKHSGNIIIPSVKVKAGPLTYDTEPVTITVNPVTAQTTAPGTAPTPPVPSLPKIVTKPKAPTAPPQKPSQNVFAKFELSNRNPYLNEQVSLALKIYHRGNLRTLNLQPLKLDNFIIQRDNKAKEYQEIIEGNEFYVYELNFILFPVKTGVTSIPATAVDTVIIEDRNINTIDPFRFMNPFLIEKPLKLLAPEIKMEVQSLPSGAPKDFTGYVGALTVVHSLKQNTIKAGEALSIETKIKGDGNFKTLNPEMVEDSKQYSIFSDKENLSEEIVNERSSFEATRSTAIIANKPKGKLSIETRPIISFNPRTKQFETHGYNKFEANIIANPDGTSPAINTEQENQELINKEQTATKLEQQTILTVPSEEILAYKNLPIGNKEVVFLILIINLIAFCFKAYKYLKGLANPISQLNTNNGSLSSYIKKTKQAQRVSEISIILKEFSTKAKRKEALEPKLEKFFEESDRANYSMQSNNGSDAQLEYFRSKAIELIKDLANAK